MVAVNYLAVLVAALAQFIIGAVFHMPPVGKLWMKLANVKPPKDGKVPPMGAPMLKNYIVNVLFAYGLMIVYMNMAASSLNPNGAGIATGICSAIIVWFFFLVTSTSVDVIWMGKSWKLWLYEAGVSLLSLIAMGAIIASM